MKNNPKEEQKCDCPAKIKNLQEKVRGLIKYTLEEVSAMNNKDDIPNTIQEQSYWESAGMIKHNKEILSLLEAELK